MTPKPCPSPRHQGRRSITFGRLLALAGIVAVGIGTLALISISGAADRDFVQYWVAGKLVIQGADPYDPATVARLEAAAGRTLPPIIVRNPPLMLPIAAAFALLEFKLASVCWMLLLVACLLVSIHLLRQSNDRTHLIGYLFAPAIMCVMAAQCGLILVLGVALFFHFHRSRCFWAACGLAIMCLKPHLFLVFFVPLFLWSLRSRQYRLLLSFGAIVAVASLWRISLWVDYWRFLVSSPIRGEYIPNVPGTLRMLTGIEALQVLPLGCGVLWGAWYWLRHREDWDWTEHGLLLLIISVLVAPYGWTTDEVVLLPAVFAVLYGGNDRSMSWFAILNGIALVEALAGLPMATGAYSWTPAAWLIWFAISYRRGLEKENTVGIPP